MGDRRLQLLDAGLELVATEGLGGLTHDAVDAGAQVAAGCTEECFPTREALIQDRELALPTPEFDPIDRLRVLIYAPGWNAP